MDQIRQGRRVPLPQQLPLRPVHGLLRPLRFRSAPAAAHHLPEDGGFPPDLLPAPAQQQRPLPALSLGPDHLQPLQRAGGRGGSLQGFPVLQGVPPGQEIAPDHPGPFLAPVRLSGLQGLEEAVVRPGPGLLQAQLHSQLQHVPDPLVPGEALGLPGIEHRFQAVALPLPAEDQLGEALRPLLRPPSVLRQNPPPGQPAEEAPLRPAPGQGQADALGGGPGIGQGLLVQLLRRFRRSPVLGVGVGEGQAVLQHQLCVLRPHLSPLPAQIEGQPVPLQDAGEDLGSLRRKDLPPAHPALLVRKPGPQEHALLQLLKGRRQTALRPRLQILPGDGRRGAVPRRGDLLRRGRPGQAAAQRRLRQAKLGGVGIELGDQAPVLPPQPLLPGFQLPLGQQPGPGHGEGEEAAEPQGHRPGAAQGHSPPPAAVPSRRLPQVPPRPPPEKGNQGVEPVQQIQAEEQQPRQDAGGGVGPHLPADGVGQGGLIPRFLRQEHQGPHQPQGGGGLHGRADPHRNLPAAQLPADLLRRPEGLIFHRQPAPRQHPPPPEGPPQEPEEQEQRRPRQPRQSGQLLHGQQQLRRLPRLKQPPSLPPEGDLPGGQGHQLHRRQGKDHRRPRPGQPVRQRPQGRQRQEEDRRQKQPEGPPPPGAPPPPQSRDQRPADAGGDARRQACLPKAHRNFHRFLPNFCRMVSLLPLYRPFPDLQEGNPVSLQKA